MSRAGSCGAPLQLTPLDLLRDQLVEQFPHEFRILEHVLAHRLLHILPVAGERPAAGGAVVRTRGVDGLAAGALHRFEVPLLRFLLLDDAILAEDLLIDVLAGEVGVGGEHIGVEVTPHHQFDDRLLHPLVDEVRYPRVPEDVRGDLLGNAGPLCNFGEVPVDGGMLERPLLVRDKD